MPRWAIVWRILLAGFLGGLVVNAVEWAAHGWWLDAPWRAAFHALGREPTGWSVFIPANFMVGILAVAGYRWACRIYGRGHATALRTSAAVWFIFWFITTMAIQPMALFPNWLLGITVLIGMIDAPAGTLVGVWMFERLGGAMPDRRVITSA